MEPHTNIPSCVNLCCCSEHIWRGQGWSNSSRSSSGIFVFLLLPFFYFTELARMCTVVVWGSGKHMHFWAIANEHQEQRQEVKSSKGFLKVRLHSTLTKTRLIHSLLHVRWSGQLFHWLINPEMTYCVCLALDQLRRFMEASGLKSFFALRP